MSEPSLVDGSVTRRIAPRGAAGVELMIVVPEPEREDEAVLLSGPQGKLLDAMLEAFGLNADQVYFASVLPRHLPGADWNALALRESAMCLLGMSLWQRQNGLWCSERAFCRSCHTIRLKALPICEFLTMTA